VIDPPPRLIHVHGTAIALGDRAALIRGQSGSGKSDLALRCLGVAPGGLIDIVARLIADDQVVVTRIDEQILVSAPPATCGQFEVRGLGIVVVPITAVARLALVVDLVAPESVERMPEAQHCLIDGVALPCLRLTPFEAASALKLLLCLQGVGH
jgi:HPr kinase/phosphorylase